ncbi:MAG: hypothetical protein ACR2GL_00815 [Thermoleophilaceae bacterium]
MRHPNGETRAEREERLGPLRHPGLREFSWPEIEPLASRLERAARVHDCKQQTWEMLSALNVRGECSVCPDVWVKGTCIPFLAYGWKGVFLIWSIDCRWTARQAAMVMPAREQIQRELGPTWPGQVEAIFHSPRETTGHGRQLLVDAESERPVDIVIVGGRLDQVLACWEPAGQVGIDPDWGRALDRACRPRWWRSAEGWREPPEPPPHDQLTS